MSPDPGLRVGHRRPVAIIAAIPANFTAYRRWRDFWANGMKLPVL